MLKILNLKIYLTAKKKVKNQKRNRPLSKRGINILRKFRNNKIDHLITKI